MERLSFLADAIIVTFCLVIGVSRLLLPYMISLGS